MKFKSTKQGSELMALGLFMLMASSAILPAGCASEARPGKSGDASDSPETMLVSYHAKPGKEAALQDALARTWAVCRKDKLVFASPHLLVREKDDAGKTRFVESFTWVSHAAPDNAPPDLKVVWRELESLCEPRDGQKGIDGSEVETVVAR